MLIINKTNYKVANDDTSKHEMQLKWRNEKENRIKNELDVNRKENKMIELWNKRIRVGVTERE